MSWLSRLKNALHPGPLDDSLDDEIRDHLERRAGALREAGLSAAEAERQARAIFGSVRRVREESREIRLSAALETTLQDVRYAWRGLRRNPVFTVTALTSLSLAIGGITAIYAVVDAAMLRPLPLPEPHRLFTLSTPAIARAGSVQSAEDDGFSYPDYVQFRDAATGMARAGGRRPGRAPGSAKPRSNVAAR